MNIFGFNIGRAPQSVEPHPIYFSMDNARQAITEGLQHLSSVLSHVDAEVNQAADDINTHRSMLQDAEARVETFRRLGLHVAQMGTDIDNILNPVPATAVAQDVTEVTTDAVNLVKFPEQGVPEETTNG